MRTKFCAHRWYCVNMIFDWGSHVFDLVVDGIVVGTRIPFEDSHVRLRVCVCVCVCVCARARRARVRSCVNAYLYPARLTLNPDGR